MNAAKKWSPAEEALLRKLYPSVRTNTLCSLFQNRSAIAINTRAKLLNLSKSSYRKAWTADEDAKLKSLWPNTSARALAVLIGCTINQIIKRGQVLGLSKDPAYIKRTCRIQPGAIPPNKGKPGKPPVNKGIRRPGWFAGRMRETQFRKGCTPINAMPLWSFRVNTDGYLLLKTGKPGPKPNSGWEFVHKLVWEQASGPLPHWTVARLWWKDGDRLNCSLRNLELVPAAEHVSRTTIHRLPEELKRVIFVKTGLRRRIKNMEKQQNEKHDGRSQESPVLDDRGLVG